MQQQRFSGAVGYITFSFLFPFVYVIGKSKSQQEIGLVGKAVVLQTIF